MNLENLNIEQRKAAVHMDGPLLIIAGTITGIPNQMGLYFTLLAVSMMPAYAVFPILSAGVILTVSIINYLMFKERPSKQGKYAMLIIAASLVLINI